MKYSIFVIPVEPLFGKLRKIIESLAEKYDGPFFPPHMTVLGDISSDLGEIKKKSLKVSSRMDPINLTLGQVSFSTTYFQSVFVRVESTAELLDLNLDLKKEFEMENNVFMPHISLLYGVDDMRLREKIASDIKIARFSFRADRLIIVPVDGNPHGWKSGLEIPFGVKI